MAFHGTTQPWGELAPTGSYWRKNGVKYPDGPPSVCADPEPLIPAFMALAPRSSSLGYLANMAGGTDFYIAETSRREFRASVGYVALLDASGFEAVELDAPEDWPDELAASRRPELRRPSAVVPECYVEIGCNDFEALLADNPNSTLTFRPPW